MKEKYLESGEEDKPADSKQKPMDFGSSEEPTNTIDERKLMEAAIIALKKIIK